jgi:predicted nucleotidyltransferase
MNLIEQNKNEIFALCTEHEVDKLYLFGSILTSKFNDNSDVDILIQFGNIDLLQYFDNYMDFKEQLEALLHRKIDIVENQAIRNPIFRNIIDREKQLIYERKSA